jgi:hypothetical protein
LGDELGTSVAISGTTAIVGAHKNGDNGHHSGSAYLIDIITGQESAKLLPSDGAALEFFGFSVAISGTTAIVGAYRDDDNGQWSGSAYLFDIATGQEITKLLPSDGASLDFFGVSVAISGPTALVGAFRNGGTGAVYVFDVNTGQEIAKLLANDGAAGDGFGIAVSISGTTAVVGASHDADNGSDSGSAYVFDITTGTQLFKLLPGDGGQNDIFGASVAISGTTAIVGAWSNDDLGTTSGSAYLFDTTSGQEIAKLLASDGGSGDAFGYSVGISGSTAIIGAPGGSATIGGRAYLFTTTGQEIIQLPAPFNYSSFGRSVAISGTTSIVGGPRYDGIDGMQGESGSAYLCQRSDTFCDSTDGSLASCPCFNPGHPDSGCDSPIPAMQGGGTTGGIRLDVLVHQTTPQNRATMTGTGFPSSNAPTAIAIRADNLHAAPIVLGDGLRCLGSPVVRLAATAAFAGASTHTIGHSSMAGAGRKYYQLWYRSSPVSYCNPVEAFNLSNGLSIVW